MAGQSYAMIGLSWTDVSVLGSQVFGQALMDSCVREYPTWLPIGRLGLSLDAVQSLPICQIRIGLRAADTNSVPGFAD